MKSIFTFMAFCFLAVTVIGQTNKTKTWDSGETNQVKSNIINLQNFGTTRSVPEGKNDYLFNELKILKFKSDQITKQMLDSFVTENVDNSGQMVFTDKSILAYDSKGDNTIVISYNWDKITNKWLSFFKSEYTYDSYGNTTISTDYSWGKTTNKWLSFSKSEYTYDSYGNKTISFDYSWDRITNQWINSNKNEYTYDSYGNITIHIWSFWDKKTNQWIGDLKDKLAYDSNGNITIHIYSRLDKSTNQLLSYEKNEYIYDANGNMSNDISYAWDNLNAKWIEFKRKECIYDSNKHWTQSIVSGHRMISTKEEASWDSNGNQTAFSIYNRDTITNQWIGDYKIAYNYDSKGNNTFNVAYRWDDITTQWIVNMKLEQTFDSFDNMTNQNTYRWDFVSNQWLIQAKLTQYYSQKDLSNAMNILNEELKIYPNPITNGFQIKGLEGVLSINFSDLNGKVWLSKEVLNNEFIPINTLSQGIYLLRINTSKGSIVKKLIKK